MIGARVLDWIVRNARRLSWVLLGIMAIIVVIDILVPTGYGRFPWDGIGGFGAVYGFISCVLIIVVSKALGYGLLYRPENYYEDRLSGSQTSSEGPALPKQEVAGETEAERPDA
jgi:uncharacterized membrane protein